MQVKKSRRRGSSNTVEAFRSEGDTFSCVWEGRGEGYGFMISKM
jgi:hypothetical protein